MCRMEKNTAEKPVVTREAKTWKARVNAIIWHARSRFASSRLEVALTWPADDGLMPCPLFPGKDLPVFADAIPSKENRL
jgi:hypothetical protein